MPVNFGGPGVTPNLGSLISTTITLNSGQCFTIPSGRWSIKPGKYTSIQEYDPFVGIWRSIGGGPTDAIQETQMSDGVNYRLANQTGCPVGAVVTTAGSGYTAANPPSVTPSAGGSLWRSIVGGAIATSVTVSNGGAGYTYPPIVIFSAPPVGGVPATGYCTLSAGAVSTVTVTDQGAGYLTPPTITFVNDPREGVNNIGSGYNAAAYATLTGAGTITALVCIDHGQGGQTAVPTFTWGSGSAAATAIMCWSITAYTVSTTTAGTGYAAPTIISGYDTPPGSSVLTNPTIQSNLVKSRAAQIVAALSGSALTATGQVVKDGGVYSAAPTIFAYGSLTGATPSNAVLSAAMGGQVDQSFILAT
jgi:hypothetical protein